MDASEEDKSNQLIFVNVVNRAVFLLDDPNFSVDSCLLYIRLAYVLFVWCFSSRAKSAEA